MEAIFLELRDEQIRRKISRLPTALERATRGTLTDGAALIMRDLTTYPPETAESTYERTFALRRSWGSRIDSGGLELRAVIHSDSNTAPYNRFVQDEADQAKVHQDRWPTTQGVGRNRQRQILDMFGARVRDELR